MLDTSPPHLPVVPPPSRLSGTLRLLVWRKAVGNNMYTLVGENTVTVTDNFGQTLALAKSRAPSLLYLLTSITAMPPGPIAISCCGLGRRQRGERLMGFQWRPSRCCIRSRGGDAFSSGDL